MGGICCKKPEPKPSRSGPSMQERLGAATTKKGPLMTKRRTNTAGSSSRDKVRSAVRSGRSKGRTRAHGSAKSVGPVGVGAAVGSAKKSKGAVPGAVSGSAGLKSKDRASMASGMSAAKSKGSNQTSGKGLQQSAKVKGQQAEGAGAPSPIKSTGPEPGISKAGRLSPGAPATAASGSKSHGSTLDELQRAEMKRAIRGSRSRGGTGGVGGGGGGSPSKWKADAEVIGDRGGIKRSTLEGMPVTLNEVRGLNPMHCPTCHRKVDVGKLVPTQTSRAPHFPADVSSPVPGPPVPAATPGGLPPGFTSKCNCPHFRGVQEVLSRKQLEKTGSRKGSQTQPRISEVPLHGGASDASTREKSAKSVQVKSAQLPPSTAQKPAAPTTARTATDPVLPEGSVPTSGKKQASAAPTGQKQSLPPSDGGGGESLGVIGCEQCGRCIGCLDGDAGVVKVDDPTPSAGGGGSPQRLKTGESDLSFKRRKVPNYTESKAAYGDLVPDEPNVNQPWRELRHRDRWARPPPSPQAAGVGEVGESPASNTAVNDTAANKISVASRVNDAAIPMGGYESEIHITNRIGGSLSGNLGQTSPVPSPKKPKKKKKKRIVRRRQIYESYSS